MCDAVDERVGKHVVALQFAVTPDSRLFAKQLTKTHPETFVKRLDPSGQALVERLIIDVRVADEDIVLKGWSRSHIILEGVSPDWLP